MNPQLPTWTVARRPTTWTTDADYSAWPWQAIEPLPPFILANGSGPATDQTSVRLVYDDEALYVRFDCDDRDIWGEATERDSQIFDEEVVELFIAPGAGTPVDYYEFEVSPLGTLLDLSVHSPEGDRRSMSGSFDWDCPGLRWHAERYDADNHWRAYLVVPWQSVGAPGSLPTTWRANFYRIERPRGQEAEFSAWSPTMTDPADYHRPAYFGTLTLGG